MCRAKAQPKFLTKKTPNMEVFFKFGPGEGLRPKRLSIVLGRRKSNPLGEKPSHMSNKKDSQKRKSFLKFGPGGIRTHDQRIMSPLRYRCATGPWRFI